MDRAFSIRSSLFLLSNNTPNRSIDHSSIISLCDASNPVLFSLSLSYLDLNGPYGCGLHQSHLHMNVSSLQSSVSSPITLSHFANVKFRHFLEILQIFLAPTSNSQFPMYQSLWIPPLSLMKSSFVAWLMCSGSVPWTFLLYLQDFILLLFLFQSPNSLDLIIDING